MSIIRVFKTAIETSLGEKPVSVITGEVRLGEITYRANSVVEIKSADEPENEGHTEMNKVKLRGISTDGKIAMITLVFPDPQVACQGQKYMGQLVRFDDAGLHLFNQVNEPTKEAE